VGIAAARRHAAGTRGKVEPRSDLGHAVSADRKRARPTTQMLNHLQSQMLNHLQFLTIRHYLSFVFMAPAVLLVVLALWQLPASSNC
jgi:hypothetical protein